MGNTFFKYKQFTVHQDKCAMKVCTDTSLFGALIDLDQPQSILDIGTGTGVLSLMVAQKTKANITAVEIDKNAAIQASNNFKESKWYNRLNVVQSDIKDFSKQHENSFDIIISNPPFFQNNMLSTVSEKNNARHNTSLSLEQLAQCVEKLLTPKGEFWVLLPQHEASKLEFMLTEYSFKIICQTNVKNYLDDSKISRTINCFSKNNQPTIEKTIAIYKDKERNYTDDFNTLLKPYYLYL